MPVDGGPPFFFRIRFVSGRGSALAPGRFPATESGAGHPPTTQAMPARRTRRLALVGGLALAAALAMCTPRSRLYLPYVPPPAGTAPPNPDAMARAWLTMRAHGNTQSLCREAGDAAPSFNALVRLRMRHERRPQVASLCDKTASRIVAESSGVPRVGLLHSDDDCDRLPTIDQLPASYSFKASHLSGCGVLVRNRTVAAVLPGCASWRGPRVGDVPSNAMLRTECLRYTGLMYSEQEWGYSRLVPRIIVEQLVLDPNGGLADDIKCFVFHGRTAFVAHVSDRFGPSGKKDTFFRRDGANANVTYWNSRQDTCAHWTSNRRPALRDVLSNCDAIGSGLDFARSPCLLVCLRAHMLAALALTRTLPFPLYRVDLLWEPVGGLRFGEVTLYPNGGRARWSPPSFDAVLGALWCLNTTAAATTAYM